MIRRLLSKLLWLANSDPPSARTRFYAMKDAILERFGQRAGHDVQRIIHPCWGERDGYDDYGDPVHRGCGPKCRRCGGTGIYDEKFIRLDRWTLGGRVFHSHPERIGRPDNSGETTWGPVTIEGRVEHTSVGRSADEAMLWLALLTGHWQLLWVETAHVFRCGRGWWPLLNLACLAWYVARAWDRVKANRCHCGRTWRHWWDGTGWCVCRECRKTKPMIPF